MHRFFLKFVYEAIYYEENDACRDTYVPLGRKQIGMAVPVKGAQIILEAILKTFAGMIFLSNLKFNIA